VKDHLHFLAASKVGTIVTRTIYYKNFNVKGQRHITLCHKRQHVFRNNNLLFLAHLGSGASLMKPMKRQLSCPFGFVCSIPSFNIILHIQVQEQCKLQRQSLTSHYCLSSRLVLSKYAFGTIYTYVEVYQFLFKFNGRKQIGRYPSQKTTLNILEKEASLS